jgi:MFS family permease
MVSLELSVTPFISIDVLHFPGGHIAPHSGASFCPKGYDMEATAYAAPLMIQARQTKRAYFGPLFVVGLFGYMIGATFLGSLADHIGRKTGIASGAFLFGAFTLTTGFTTSLSEVLALLFIEGPAWEVGFPQLLL